MPVEGLKFNAVAPDRVVPEISMPTVAPTAALPGLMPLMDGAGAVMENVTELLSPVGVLIDTCRGPVAADAETVSQAVTLEAVAC